MSTLYNCSVSNDATLFDVERLIDHSVSAFSSSAAITATRNDIDATIKAMFASVYALRRRRNELVEIAKLPAELLCKIFKAASSLPWGKTWGRRYHGWISVSHVCAHWRQAALNCPSLWTHISSTPTGLLRAMLGRSKAAPLTVLGDTLRGMGDRILAIEKVQHIQVLNFDFHKQWKTFETETAHARLAVPAPCLEKFLVRGINDEENPTTTLSDNIFAGHTPRLRHLVVFYCNLSWKSNLFNGLTTLKVVSSPFRRTSGPDTFTELFSTLDSLPSLEQLHLQNILPHPPSSPPPLSVHLPCLAHLYLESHDTECAYFLDNVTYPPKAAVQVMCEVSLKNPSTRSVEFLSRAGGCFGEPIRHVSVEGGSIDFDPVVVLKFWAQTQTCIEPRFSVRIRTSLTSLDPIWTLLPLADVESLRVSKGGLQLNRWRGVAEQLTQVKKLYISGGDSICLSEALTPKVDDSLLGEPSVFVPFPSLEEITIASSMYLGFECAKHLPICLMKRRNHGHGIQELRVKNCCDRNPELMDDFVRIVPTVIVE